MSIISETKVNREVIPILTADNYQDVIAQFRERPIPESIRERLQASVNGLGRFTLDNVTTANSESTEWLVSQEDDKIWLTSKLPCSFPHCAGHGSGGLEDTWAELSHKIVSLDLSDNLTVGDIDRHDAGAALYIRAEGAIVDFYMHVEGEVPVTDVMALADYFAWVSMQLGTIRIPVSE